MRTIMNPHIEHPVVLDEHGTIRFEMPEGNWVEVKRSHDYPDTVEVRTNDGLAIHPHSGNACRIKSVELFS